MFGFRIAGGHGVARPVYWPATMWLPRLVQTDSWRDTLAESMRRTHARWLTRAMRAAPPRSFRIPRRRVEEGGFDRLMRTRAGRDWADRWWERAFDAADKLTGR